MKIKSIISVIPAFLILIGTIPFQACNKQNKNETTNKTEIADTNNRNKEIQLSDNFIISYDLVGKVNGKMQILRKGNLFKQIINSEVMGMQNKNNVYILGSSVYSVTEIAGKKFGIKTNLHDYNTQKQTGETIVDFKEFEKFLNSKKITGSENILGYDCEIYEISDGFYLTVKNKKYIMKIKTPEFTATATTMDTNPSFTLTEFEIPSDIDFKNANASGYDKSAIDSLVNKMKK